MNEHCSMNLRCVNAPEFASLLIYIKQVKES